MLRTVWARQRPAVCDPARRVSYKKLYPVLREPAFETIKVPCGVSTPLTIKVHHPSSSIPLPILLYITASTPSHPPPPTPLPLLSPSHITVHISPPWSGTSPFPLPLHKLHFAYAHILGLFRPTTSRSHRYPPISLYGDTLGGSLATSLALTECRPTTGAGRYPSALVTTDSIFDFSPLAIETLYPSATPSSSVTSELGRGVNIKSLFSNPSSTLDPFASPLLLFRGPGYLPSTFPTSWEPTRPPPWASSQPSLPTSPTSTPEDAAATTESTATEDAAPINTSTSQKMSYLKFPPAQSSLHLPLCNFQVSHAMPPPPASKASKSSASSLAKRNARKSSKLTARDPITAPTIPENHLETIPTPLATTQSQLLAAAIRRAVSMGYESSSTRRAYDDSVDASVDERAIVSVLEGLGKGGGGDMVEEGAVGAVEWLQGVEGWK